VRGCCVTHITNRRLGGPLSTERRRSTHDWLTLVIFQQGVSVQRSTGHSFSVALERSWAVPARLRLLGDSGTCSHVGVNSWAHIELQLRTRPGPW
jgi:hypothetical protein